MEQLMMTGISALIMVTVIQLVVTMPLSMVTIMRPVAQVPGQLLFPPLNSRAVGMITRFGLEVRTGAMKIQGSW